MTKQVALVTGISSGIGRTTAIELARAGWKVFGTLRSRSQRPPDGVEAVILDVRDEASVEAAVQEVVAKAGRIDLLVNNAGGTLVGAIEETDVAQAQALFDVNFFGAVRVTRAVLPVMRGQRGGHIVFVSSVVGFVPAPFMGFYAASKHALEGYAKSLAVETRGFGIRVALVEPGFTRTSIDANTARAARPIDAYAGAREQASRAIQTQVEGGDDPLLSAQAVLAAATEDGTRLRYPVGAKATGLLGQLRLEL